MATWNTFSNSSPNNQPDGVKMMQNWAYLFQKGTKAELEAIAVATPLQPFIAIATDIKNVFVYTGDVTIGQAGFISLGGGSSW